MTLEWIALLLLVPVVLVPTVLLYGFSGCNLVFGLESTDTPSAGPVITSAEALDVSSIRITWTFDSSGSTVYEVRRTLAGDTTATSLPPTPALTLDDTGLADGATYVYQVVAIESDVESLPSNQVAASTFGKTFEAVLDGDAIRQRRTIVQRIEPARLARGGTRVIVTLQSPALGGLVINAATISQAADAGYTPAGDLTPIITAPRLIPADPTNAPVVLDPHPFDYTLDHTQPLLIAFDIDTPGNVREQLSVAPADATAFVSPIGVFEATQPVRSPGYNTETRIYLVQRIDVV